MRQQITRHKDLLRSSHKWTRRRSGDSRPVAQVPFEQTLAALQPSTISAEDIRSYVNANLSRLERFVERELYFREAAEQMVPDSVTKEEVIDEVIAAALGDGGDKPEKLALEPWLYRLAIHAIGDLQARSSDNVLSVHLEDSARTPNVRASDEPELQFHQPDETFTRESVIADRRIATPEDIASSDEMDRLMETALAAAKPRDREVFILHTIEGFSVAEIAAITDRKAEAISASIVAAREHLRRSPHRRSFKEPDNRAEYWYRLISAVFRRVRMITREDMRELAQFQGMVRNVQSVFIFSRPVQRTSRTGRMAFWPRTWYVRPCVKPRKMAATVVPATDLQRILEAAGDWAAHRSQAKAVFACSSRKIWREFDLPPQLAKTELFVNRRFRLKPLARC